MGVCVVSAHKNIFYPLIDDIYVLCENCSETLDHVLIHCEFSRYTSALICTELCFHRGLPDSLKCRSNNRQRSIGVLYIPSKGKLEFYAS